MFRLDSYGKLPWEKKADERYWTHITLGEVGIPLTYYSRGDNGKTIQRRVEVVTEEGLFNDESVRSVAGLPVLLEHPPHKTYNLNNDGLRVGTILSAVGKEGGKLIAEVIIDDYRGVQLIERMLAKGLIPEASSGYQVTNLNQREDGLWEQYRGIYDHVAAPLMPGGGRGGQDLVLRFDQEDAVNHLFFDLGEKQKLKDIIVRMDEKEIIIKDVSAEVEDAIAFLQKRNDTLSADLEGTKKKIEELQNQQLDKIQIDEEIRLRLDAWAEVQSVIPELKTDASLNVTEIKKAAIAVINPKIVLDGKSEEYIEGIWDGAKNVSALRGIETDNFLDSSRADTSNGKSAHAIAYENAHKRIK